MILLLRHGETDYILRGMYQGESQVPRLTVKGCQQIEYASAYLQKVDVSRIFYSPYNRARESLHILRRRTPSLKCDVIESSALAEISIPEWVGLLKRNIRINEPERYDVWQNRLWEFSCRDGSKPLGLLYERIQEFTNEIKKLPGKTLLVGHDHVNRAIIATLLGFPISAHSTIPQSLGSLSAVTGLNSDSGPRLAFSGLREESCIVKRDVAVAERPRLILVRECENTVKSINVPQEARMDSELCDRGINQALRSKDLIRKTNPGFVLCSTRGASVRTADLLDLDVPILYDARLDEFDDWPEPTRSAARLTFETQDKCWLSLENKNLVSSSEALGNLVSRVRSALEIAWRYALTYETVVVISQDVILQLLTVLSLGLPIETRRSFRFDHACITELSRPSDNKYQLTLHNFRPVNIC